MFLFIAVILIITAIGVWRKHCHEPFVYNYVELSTKYKRYTVVDKYKKNDYYHLNLQNPYVNDRYSNVIVTENIYYNIYFVGDTIK